MIVIILHLHVRMVFRLMVTCSKNFYYAQINETNKERSEGNMMITIQQQFI